MIITKDDIDGFEAALQQVIRAGRYRENVYGGYYEGREGELELNNWVAENPQVLMAGARLQEFVGGHSLPLYYRLVREGIILGGKHAAFRDYNGQWLISSCRDRCELLGYKVNTLERVVENLDTDEDVEDLLESALIELPSAENVIEEANKYVDNALVDPTTIISPKLWTPTAQEFEKKRVQSVALPIIRAIQAEKCELGSLHWRQLEDIVAEILRKSGMEIQKVRSAPQGGRDIIARVQLAPGEMITMAVEVKHRAVVDRPELQTALYQNAQFPALMLVTSGRFSAGVIKEAALPENRLRLFLKDGVALGELINSYIS